MSEIVEPVVVLLSNVLVIVSLAISASSTLKRMVMLYQTQAWALAAVVLLTSTEPDSRASVALVAFLPALLAVSVPPLLARASVHPAPEPPSDTPATWGDNLRTVWSLLLRREKVDAELIWLQHGESRLGAAGSSMVDVALIAIAVLVAYRLVGSGQPEGEDLRVVASLAVSIALVLQGLLTMVNKQDIVAQVIGLLVIEHGLFLAAVRVAPSGIALLLVLGLLFYILVTLTILFWILPALHRVSSTISVDTQSELVG